MALVFIIFFFPSSWGLMQPGILSVPELCHHVAEAWVSGGVFVSWLMHYKRNNRGTVRTPQKPLPRE